MSRLVGKQTMWFPNRSDTNRAVQAQERARSLKRNCTIRVAKTKALISFAVTAKLICAFVFAYMQIAGFPMWRLKYPSVNRRD